MNNNRGRPSLINEPVTTILQIHVKQNVPSQQLPSVVSHKRLELFSLIFSHSGASATGLDALQRLFAPV